MTLAGMHDIHIIQPVHGAFLLLQKRMRIDVQRCRDIGMPQYFAECFNVYSQLQCAGCKGMAHSMKFSVFDSGRCQNPLKKLLIGSWLHRHLSFRKHV